MDFFHRCLKIGLMLTAETNFGSIFLCVSASCACFRFPLATVRWVVHARHYVPLILAALCSRYIFRIKMPITAAHPPTPARRRTPLLLLHCDVIYTLLHPYPLFLVFFIFSPKCKGYAPMHFFSIFCHFYFLPKCRGYAPMKISVVLCDSIYSIYFLLLHWEGVTGKD